MIINLLLYVFCTYITIVLYAEVALQSIKFSVFEQLQALLYPIVFVGHTFLKTSDILLLMLIGNRILSVNRCFRFNLFTLLFLLN